MRAFGAGKEFFFVFWIILPLLDAIPATAVCHSPAIQSKLTDIHMASISFYSVLTLWFFFHALTHASQPLFVFASALYPWPARCRTVQTISSSISACRVLVSAALRFSQYAVSRYTFRSLPRSARLGIVHCWSSTEFSRFGPYCILVTLYFHIL